MLRDVKYRMRTGCCFFYGLSKTGFCILGMVWFLVGVWGGFCLVLGSSLANILDTDQEKEIPLVYQTDKCLC